MEEPTPKHLTPTNIFLFVVIALAAPAIVAHDSELVRASWALSWMLLFGVPCGAFGNAIGRQFHVLVGGILAVIFGTGGIILGLMVGAYISIVVLHWPMGIC